MLERLQLMENILRIWVYITVLKRMKPQLCFFLKKPSLVLYVDGSSLDSGD